MIPTKFDGVVLLEPKAFEDGRGFFMESYNRRVLEKALGRDCNLVQDNHSFSTVAGTLRGLHYQLNPRAQAKIVWAVTGAIFDAVVDLRTGSPTYGQWFGAVLTESNRRQIVVPRGFAHGICTLVPNTRIFYKTDEYYSPEHERGIAWNDPDIGIAWPVTDPFLSDKDQRQPGFKQAETNFVFQA